MFNSTILDVAIGMIFVYLLLSLVCSAANEVIELWLKNRAADLERGLRELLKDPEGKGLVKDLYEHQLINGLFEGEYDRKVLSKAQRLFGRVNLPSYIPARNFALALMDTILPGKGAAGATPATLPPAPLVVNVAASPPPAEVPDPLRPLRDKIQEIGNDQVKKALTALVAAAGKDVAKARENIENWYNSSMDRVSGWYKRRSQFIVLVIGLLVTIAVNADSVTIAKKLASDRALRESLVAAADAYAKANASPTASPTPTPSPKATPATSASQTASPAPTPSPTPTPRPTATPTPTPSTTPTPTPSASSSGTMASTSPSPPASPSPSQPPCWKLACDVEDSPQCKLKKSQCEIQALGLPIGWDAPDDIQRQWPGWHWKRDGGWWDQLYWHWVGWLLTALAISLGAPFWFDLLNKFIVVRSTVKPREKSHEEPSKD